MKRETRKDKRAKVEQFCFGVKPSVLAAPWDAAKREAWVKELLSRPASVREESGVQS